MSDSQIQELLAEANVDSAPEQPDPPAPPIDPPKQKVDLPNQENPKADPVSPLARSPEDVQAAEILSAPPSVPSPTKPTGVSPVLKTRADLIAQIKRVAESRGEDVKPLNLGRRRKKSLQGILQDQLREAVRQEMEPEIHPDLKGKLEGVDRSTEFVVNMCYRFDLTVCKLLEVGVDASSGWHGLTASGFAENIENNNKLTSEIKACWEEIINEPDNQWIV